ncbi:hypothetical protein [Fibrella aquatica]|uniref:hypothetical protein n=1 Tax=Fibrella aquatica TaxID=3242487 RepID=UPI003522309F
MAPSALPVEVPSALTNLYATLASSSNSRRSAVLWASPSTYAVGPQWAAHGLGLAPRHLGRAVVATCEAQGTQRVPRIGALLWQHVLAVHAATGPAGTWLAGLDALLLHLPASERVFFWHSLWELRQRPPLILVLPDSFRDVGPTDPGRWLTADPPRGLHL